MWAIANSNGDPAVAMALTNGIENIIASTIGAGAGAAIDGGSGALNGLGISSDLQQYNQAAERPEIIEEEAKRDENGNLIDPDQENYWKTNFYNYERELSELCQDCSALSSMNPVITEEMFNDAFADLNAAKELKESGRPVTAENIEKVKEWNSRNTPTVSAPNTPLLNGDLFSGPADIAKGDPSNYDTLPDFPLKDNSASNFNQSYLDEMSANGVKFSPDQLVRVEKLDDGRIVFLEKGDEDSGLQHIIGKHKGEFTKMGVSESEIPDIIMEAVKGKPVAYQGKGTGRPIYEITINGQRQRIAITTSSNGYIVGANSAGSVK